MFHWCWGCVCGGIAEQVLSYRNVYVFNTCLQKQGTVPRKQHRRCKTFHEVLKHFWKCAVTDMYKTTCNWVHDSGTLVHFVSKIPGRWTRQRFLGSCCLRSCCACFLEALLGQSTWDWRSFGEPLGDLLPHSLNFRNFSGLQSVWCETFFLQAGGVIADPCLFTCWDTASGLYFIMFFLHFIWLWRSIPAFVYCLTAPFRGTLGDLGTWWSRTFLVDLNIACFWSLLGIISNDADA